MALLDRELQILHVTIVLLKPLGDFASASFMATAGSKGFTVAWMHMSVFHLAMSMFAGKIIPSQESHTEGMSNDGHLLTTAL